MLTEDSHELIQSFQRNLQIKNSKEYKLFYHFLRDCNLLTYTITEINSKIGVKIDSPFISPDILRSCQALSLNRNYKIKINECLIIVHLFYDQQIDIQKFVDTLCIYLQFLFSLTYNSIKIKNFEVNYYLTDHKKLLSTNYTIPHIITTNEINSGSCQHSFNKKIINIWRIEDILKTTLHEFIHALELDNCKDDSDIVTHYQHKYNISSNVVNTNESYTELIANLLNCFLISKTAVRIKESHRYKSFLNLLHLEKEFCHYQAHKILYLSNIKKSQPLDINQNTNTLSYFIIRDELFQNLSLFLKQCRLNNTDYLVINTKMWFNYILKNKIIKKKNSRFKNKRLLKFNVMKFNLLDLSLY